jgi:hypothetical protein
MTTPIFYTLKQIENYHFTNLKYRMIKNRFKELISTGGITKGNLVFKKGNRWQIHYSLLDKFQAKRKHKSHSKVEYQSELTINFDSNYDLHFYHYIGSQVLKGLDPNQSAYCIEASDIKKNTYHIHFATTASYPDIYAVLYKIEEYLDLNIVKNKNTHIATICNKALYHNYMNKAVFGWGLYV